jgi:hypothetical protein
MAQSTTADDYADDVVDPNQIQANITAGDNQQIVAANGFAARNAAVQQAGGNAIGQGFSQMTGDQNVGDPRVVQARHIQTAMQQILQASNQGADPNESPLDKQERIATAVAAGMANVSPQIALKASQQGVAIQEAKAQQSLLQANVGRIKQVTEEDQTKIDLQKASAVYQVHATTVGKDGLPNLTPYGDPVPLYNEDGSKNPDFLKTLNANVASAKASGAQSPQWSTVDKFNDSKLAVQTARGQAQAVIQAQKDQDKAKLLAAATDIPEDTMRYLAGQSAFVSMNDAVKGRGANTQATVQAITAYKAAKGLTPADEVMARAEIQGLRSGERAIGTRAGNTEILQNEMTGLAQNVTDAIAAVDRTKIPMINSVIKTGNIQALGSGPEARYAAAIQAFTTAHGRLIAGATGVTSDNATARASELVTGTQSPEAVKATLNQIIGQEVPVIRGASENAIGIMAQRNKYPGINKIANALGYPIDAIVPQGSSSPQSSTNTNPPPKAPAPASTGWGKAMKVSPDTIDRSNPGSANVSG